MSANNIAIHSAEGYNYYTLQADGRRFIIGGVPDKHAASYIQTAADCDAVILLTSKPEFTGGLDGLLDIKPDIEIYGGSACLRNIKEIVNRPVNEKLIKDKMVLCGIKFMVMPGLDWVDTVMAIYNGALFSGQLFSGRTWFDSRLAVNRGFVLSALDRLKQEEISVIYPAHGEACGSGTLDIYREWAEFAKSSTTRAAVVYSSVYGYTKSLALHAAERLDVSAYDVNEADTEDIINAVNAADMLIIGTNTINRNAPGKIWNVITRLDLVNKRGMPYFVFGSFGWAGDGIKLVDKTLSAMGMRQAAKPVEVLFKPSEKDFERMNKAVERIIAYDSENSGK